MELCKIVLNEKNVKRLESVCKVTDYLIVRIKNNTITFIGDGGTFFKAVTMSCESEWNANFKVDSDAFVNIRHAGYLGIASDTETNSVFIAFNYTKEAFDDGLYKTLCESPIQLVEDYDMREYLMIMKGASANLLHIDDLANLKDVIKVCTYNKVGIEISRGYVKTASNVLKMYKKVSDSDLSIALDLDALKEIDKFGTDCTMHNVANYLVLSRDNFILAVKKCTISNIEYPARIMEDSEATTATGVNITGLFDLIKTYDKNLEKISTGYVKLDFSESMYEVFNGRSRHVVDTYIKYGELPSGLKANSVKIPLANLNGLGILKGLENIVIYTYGNILRISLEDGINLILKGEVA